MQSAFFTTVTPHFHDQHTVTLLGSTVSTQYDFEITESLAEYNIQTQINCVSVNSNRPDCLAFGHFNITPRTDVWVEATGSYSYSLPTDPTAANANFRVRSFPSDDVAFGDGFGDDTFLSGPHNGLYNIHASGLIPAGMFVQINYEFRTIFLTGSANLPAASSGNLHFTMTPVPEPAALGPLMLSALAIVRRRSTRRL